MKTNKRIYLLIAMVIYKNNKDHKNMIIKIIAYSNIKIVLAIKGNNNKVLKLSKKIINKTMKILQHQYKRLIKKEEKEEKRTKINLISLKQEVKA